MLIDTLYATIYPPRQFDESLPVERALLPNINVAKQENAEKYNHFEESEKPD
jgi:hypothetical protein